MGHVSGSIGLSGSALDTMLSARGFAAPTVRNSSPAMLRRWTVARGRAQAMSGLAIVNLIGDSTQGLVGTGTGISLAEGGRPRSLAAQLVTLLNARAGRNDFARSDGYWGNHFSTAGNLATFLAYDTRWTTTGNVTQDGVSVAGGSISSPAGSTGTIVLAPTTLPYDRVRVIALRGTGFGTLTIGSASGGSDTMALAGSAGSVDKTVSVTRGTGAMTIAADSGFCRIIAVELWDSTSGQVIVRDMAYSGATANSYGQSASAMALLGCDFLNVSFGLNDMAANKAPATLVSELTALIAGYCPGGSVTLTVENESSAGWNGNATLSAQRGTADAIRAMGLANGYPVIDLPARWGDYAIANANGLMANDPHPNAAGYADKAVALMHMLWS